jgi:hypothetical protein
MFFDLTQLLGIRKTRTTPLHPQSNGQVERQHQTLLNYLAKFVSENQKDWDRWVPLGLLAYRSSKHEITGFTPSELCLGRELRLPLDLLRGCPPNVRENFSVSNYYDDLREKMNLSHVLAKGRMEMKSQRIKTLYDRKVRQLNFEPGQKVWLFNPRRKLGRAPKLQSNWEGPYVIVKRLNDVVYCIRKSDRYKSKIVHLDRLATFLER